MTDELVGLIHYARDAMGSLEFYVAPGSMGADDLADVKKALTQAAARIEADKVRIAELEAALADERERCARVAETADRAWQEYARAGGVALGAESLDDNECHLASGVSAGIAAAIRSGAPS